MTDHLKFNESDEPSVCTDYRFVPIIIHKNKKQQPFSVKSKPDHTAEVSEETKIKHVSKECSQTIIAARCAKNMKQSDLANKINVPCKVIQELESGKAIVDSQLNNVLQKVRKCLGTKISK
jgi:ribosome-binding protein aMBF1 (putative translation factor)